MEQHPQLDAILEKIDALSCQLDLSSDRPLTLEQAADYLGITPSGLYKLNAKYAIPYHKPGQRVYYKRADLDAYMLSNRIATKAEIDAQSTRIAMTPRAARKGTRSH